MHPRSKSLIRHFAGPLVALLLAGCVATPKLPPRAELRTPESIAADRSLAPDAAAAWPEEAWWRDLGDPQLAALIEEGLARSPDVAAAAARYRRAQAYAMQAGAARLPTLDASASAGFENQSYNNGFPSQFVSLLPQGWNDSGETSIVAGFDPDLWGRNRALFAAATSEERAAAIDAVAARLMIASGIALAYADLAQLFDEREILAATLDLRLATQRLVADRHANGLETRGTLRQSEAEVANARGHLAWLEEVLAQRRNLIAALVGAGPDRGLEIARPSYATPAGMGLPQGVTTELVGRRPDIAAARERAGAAASRIKAARADFYPAVRLEALVGLRALGLDNLFEDRSTFGNVGGAISLPIFRGGEIKARYRVARASFDEAAAEYDRTVLDSYQQVADAVTSQRQVAERLSQARASEAASQEAYAIIRSRYEGGLSTYLDVIAVEDRLLQARLSRVQLEATARRTDIALIRALGGGFGNGANTADKDKPDG